MSEVSCVTCVHDARCRESGGSNACCYRWNSTGIDMTRDEEAMGYVERTFCAADGRHAEPTREQQLEDECKRLRIEIRECYERAEELSEIALDLQDENQQLRRALKVKP